MGASSARVQLSRLSFCVVAKLNRLDDRDEAFRLSACVPNDPRHQSNALIQCAEILPNPVELVDIV